MGPSSKLLFSRKIFALHFNNASKTTKISTNKFTEKIVIYQKLSKVSYIHTYSVTVWKNKKFSLNEKIFREISYLVTSLVKPLFSRNFCQKSVRENFRNFHTVSVEMYNFSATQILREINFRDSRSSKTCLFVPF